MYDAHLHLQDARFDTCREAVIAAAVAAGVTEACCCGCAPDDWAAVERMRNANFAFRMLPAFGVHPWYAGKLATDWLTLLEQFLVRHPEAPVGEIGMDGLRDDPPRKIQRQVLCAQLELAVRLNRPVVLHGARAWGELLEVIKPFALRLPGFVAHAFGGSDDILRVVVNLGGFVSFAGAVCNPAAKRVRAAAVAAPMDRLLIETDAPDMLPGGQDSGFRVQGSGLGRASPLAAADGACSVRALPAGGITPVLGYEHSEGLNHPANLVYMARAVAELRGMPVEEIGAITTANARRVYRME